MKRSDPFLFTLLLLFSALSCLAQPKTDKWLQAYIWRHASDSLRAILQQPDTFRYQIIYTRIDRSARNTPSFHDFYYHVDPDNYFNPASTVKMPLAFLALEKINSLRNEGLTRSTPMITGEADTSQTEVTADTSSINGLPSVEHYIKKIFLVSDNDAYSRLYEFLGQEGINKRLWQMGYKDVRITRRFVPMTDEQNRLTNPINFSLSNGNVYTQPAQQSKVQFDFTHTTKLGWAHWDRNDKLVPEPMDFTRHNNISLPDLHMILRSVMFPQSVPPSKRFNLTADDYRFLYQYMSEYPYESSAPKYDTIEFFKAYTKFLYRGGKQQIPTYIRIFNKPGWSYGFLTDVAYVADFKNNIEFMISAVIYVNKDGVLNDGKYEYEEKGWPFFRELGEIMYQYELTRQRKHKPDLSAFQMNYK